jgi:hypothetical protein
MNLYTKKPSIGFKQAKLINVIDSNDGRAPIMAHDKGHYELETVEELKHMQQRNRGYKIINNTLFKAGVCTPLLDPPLVYILAFLAVGKVKKVLVLWRCFRMMIMPKQ